ncbi:dihydrofolate reductase family protein [Aeromicrobium sp. 9AM]|uniref:dihydrofolate reductase family protein n=1 Tax=Aeromicrobium sp. 9AM TaxID=2653126 RepID=UPI0012F2D981|nr:dihydrofolate reductase family protein [Aeromicrobium sp. 9AM]VXC26963.1 hypothetical protein AERO9AM_50559 [Aeromicrobium sp. 9AM]
MGSQPAVPHACHRAHAPGACFRRDGRRHDVSLPERLARRGTRRRTRGGGLDVRIGGGATVIKDFLTAGLVDHMHLVQVPIVLGRGTRVWDGQEALEDTYDIEAVSTPSGVTHLTFTRKSR